MLIIGAAYNYPKDEIGCMQFFESLKNVGYRDHCFIATEHPGGLDGKDAAILRYEMYYNILKDISSNPPNRIILTDVRDVIFQRNPSFMPIDRLMVFQEDDSKTIGSCEYNSNWIARDYGEHELQYMKDMPITCCGVVVGPYWSVVEYVNKMMQQLKTRKEHGADTSAHAYLVYRKKIDCDIIQNEVGNVYTVGYTKNLIINNHKILQKNGNTPFMVHQYDRHVRVL